jgi:hypothetical protein
LGIARQSNTKPPPLPVGSSGNPRLYENDMTDTFIACLLPFVRQHYTIIRKRLKEITLSTSHIAINM